MTTRRKLPNRRESTTAKFSIHTSKGIVKLYCTCGLYKNGEVGEVFLSVGNTGSDERAWIDMMARTVSVSLQSGVPLKKFVDMFCGVKMETSGVVTGCDSIKFCTSPLDLVFRWLGIEYLGMKELGVNQK